VLLVIASPRRGWAGEGIAGVGEGTAGVGDGIAVAHPRLDFSRWALLPMRPALGRLTGASMFHILRQCLS